MVDRITLVELIEGETGKLSPRGRELWEEMEILLELSPEEQDASASLAALTSQTAELPPLAFHTLDRLMKLREGLYASEKSEERGESGEHVRDRAVIIAASLKDKIEGRQIDPDMTVELAVARLRQ